MSYWKIVSIFVSLLKSICENHWMITCKLVMSCPIGVCNSVKFLQFWMKQNENFLLSVLRVSDCLPCRKIISGFYLRLGVIDDDTAHLYQVSEINTKHWGKCACICKCKHACKRLANQPFFTHKYSNKLSKTTLQKGFNFRWIIIVGNTIRIIYNIFPAKRV